MWEYAIVGTVLIIDNIHYNCRRRNIMHGKQVYECIQNADSVY